MRIIINGASGKLAFSIINYLLENGYQDLIGVDVKKYTNQTIKTYKNLDEIKENADIIIDCSSSNAISNVLDYSIRNNLPLIICTTGFSNEQLKTIIDSGNKIPILLSPNMSFGANVFFNEIEKLTKNLPDWEVEIVETHHKQKIDKPSGTAKRIKDIIFKKTKKDVPIHSLRLANNVGEHKVIFASDTEIITIEHKATSRTVFAVGVLKSILFLQNKNKGFYTFKDIVNDKRKRKSQQNI